MNHQERPDDDNLTAAVLRMTEAATAANRPRLILTEEAWCALLEPMIRSGDTEGMIRDLLERLGRRVDSLDELNHWAALLTNISNHVPQSDRNGQTAKELLRVAA